MPIDPRRLRPSEACRLLNSTPLGEVISERQLLRHRTRAGLRIGDGKHVDLLKYVGWLANLRHAPPPEPVGDPYEQVKERARARNAALALAGRDIGELPAVANPARKQKAACDFRFFCEAYFPQTFHLPWSPDHLKVIAKIEEAVLRGGLFAMAMPRGSGKTSLCECACIWAANYGHRDFIALIGSDEGHAMDMLESIKTELDANDLLFEDFPEVCYPIQKLDGIANRCAGQLYQGERTHIGWTARDVALPTIEGSPASGAVIKVAGITGGIRGMKCKRADGKTVRPSLVVIDDPQTDQSARSLSQCATREQILAGAILGLAGPGKKIAGVMPCTVIRPGDMADEILNKDKRPEWNGERTKMVYAFPKNEKLWERYAEVRAESLRSKGDLSAATDFYLENREAMDEGAEVAWKERFNYDEASAIQHAMNLKLQDEAAFFAEYQNEPLPEEKAPEEVVTADFVMRKLNRMPRRSIPIGCQQVTAFVDVQATLLYYVVCAWESNFTGYVVDYGTWPDQQRQYFTLRDARRTLAIETKASGLEGSIYAGLERLTDELLGKPWKRDDGAELRIAKCLIDANWGTSTDVVYQFCRQAKHASVVIPSHGRFVGASSQPFSEYKRRPGDQIGQEWRIPNVAGKRAIRHVVFDANFWKSFVYARLAVTMGDRGCLSLYGSEAERHRMLAEHVTSEYRIKTEGRGRTVDEWKLRPERGDNHWFDGMVGCAVAASIGGAAVEGTQRKPEPPKRYLSMSEMARLKQAQREKREFEGWMTGGR